MANLTSVHSGLKKVFNEIGYSLRHPGTILRGNIFKNTVILLSGDATARIISLASLVLTVRKLGPELFGILALSEIYAKLIDRLLNFQSWSGVIKFGAEAIQKSDDRAISRIIQTGYILDAVSAFCGLTVAYFVAPFVGRFLGWNTTVVETARTYSLLIMFNITGTATGILRLTEHFSLIATQRLLYSLIRISGVLLAVLFNGSLGHFVMAWMFSECCGYLILNIFAYRVITKNGWNITEGHSKNVKIKQFVSFIIWTNLSSTADIPVKFLDVFFVSKFVSIEAAGVYKVFQQVSHVLKKPVEPLYHVLYPHFSNQVAARTYSNLIKSVLKSFVFLLSAATLVSSLLALSSGWWLPAFFGRDFSRYTGFFSYFIAVQALNVAILPIHPLFLALGLVQKNFTIQLIANICFMISAWYLGSLFGFYGIINALGIHLILVFCLKSIFSARELKRRKATI